MLDSLSDK